MSQKVRFDWAMKNLFRKKSDFVVLEGLLSELLKETIIIEEILESESNKNRADDKSNRVDLLVRNSKKEHIIIEVQCHQEWDFLSRILYGTSKVITENISQGDEYLTIPKVISVNIVYFDIGKGKDYIYKGSTKFEGVHYQDILELNDKEKKVYTDHKNVDKIEKIFPEYYIIRIDIFNNTVKDTLDQWMFFLKNSEIKPEFTAQGLQEASERFDILNLTPDQKAAYEIDSNNLSLEKSWINSAKLEGKIEEKIEFAKKLLTKNYAIDEIVELTGLSIAEIEKLVIS